VGASNENSTKESIEQQLISLIKRKVYNIKEEIGKNTKKKKIKPQRGGGHSGSHRGWSEEGEKGS